MYKTAFSTLISEDDFIYTVVEKINATDESIKFAIDNKIDIIDLTSKIVGTIGLLHVVEEYELQNPKKTMTKEAITKIILDAINASDKKTLMANYVTAKKNKIDKDMLKIAKELIKTLPDEIIAEPLQVQQPVIVPASTSGSIYAARRRR